VAWHRHDITVPMNPLGPNGFLIKAGEHLPLVADGLRCYHKFKGQIEAEERARAFSLQRYLAKDGALVKVAELLPGSNLIASAMLDLRGHHQEAQEALNLLKNWRQCGSPDGPLAKVAEMLPGVDVIAFGIHVQSGNFAQALRSISKTRWTTITGESIVLTMMAETLHDWTITDLEVVKLDIDPVASFMYGGLLDVVTLLIEVNSQGQQRSRARARRVRLNSPRLDGKPHRGLRNPLYWAKDRVVTICRDVVTTLLQDTLPEMVPDMIDSAVAAINSLLPYYRSSWWPYRVFLPKAIGKPPPDLEKVLADRITHISLRHRTVVPVRAVPARDLPCRRPGTDKALGALCCCAGGLAHSGWPLLAACALGCASGFFQLSSWARRQFVPWINAHNEQAWLGATKEPKQLYKRSSSQGSCDRASARMPLAVVAELPGEDVEQLASILGDYFCKELPLTKLIGQSGMAWLNERLSRFLAASVDEQTSPAVLPVVLHAEVSEGLYKSLGETWWLPSFSFAVIFQCRLEAGMQVSAAQVVFTDETIDQVLDVLQTEIRDVDFRGMDPRLAGFAEPINLHFQAMLSWPLTSSPRLDIRNLKVHLSLPG